MGVLNNLEVNTKDLLDTIDNDDLMIYLYQNKLISHQAVKKYFGIKDICELPNISYCTKVDLEDDLGISDEDILDEMWDDDIYQYLEANGYDFPEPEEPDPEEVPYFDNFWFINDIKWRFNKRFGRTFSHKELKEQINDAIDWYSEDPKG